MAERDQGPFRTLLAILIVAAAGGVAIVAWVIGRLVG
jgi:hypothetical protein